MSGRLESQKKVAQGYFDEILGVITERNVLREFIGANGPSLFPALADSEQKRSLTKSLESIKVSNPGQMYQGLVIRACATFEHYVRSSVKVIVEDTVAPSSDYASLSESFRNSHAQIVGTALRQIKSGTVNGRPFNFADLMVAISGCFSNASGFDLHSELYAIELTSCSPSNISETFSRLDQQDPFDDSLGDHQPLRRICGHTNSSRKTVNEAKKRLSNFITERNRLAHNTVTSSVTENYVINEVGFLSVLVDALHERFSRY